MEPVQNEGASSQAGTASTGKRSKLNGLTRRSGHCDCRKRPGWRPLPESRSLNDVVLNQVMVRLSDGGLNRRLTPCSGRTYCLKAKLIST